MLVGQFAICEHNLNETIRCIHIRSVHTILRPHNITHSYLDDSKDFWHVVSSMLLDDGDDLPQLLEEVLAHVLITATNHTQEGRHHLRRGGGGGGGGGRGGEEEGSFIFCPQFTYTCIP